MPAHSVFSIREFLADKEIPVVLHPLTHQTIFFDFFYFQKLKHPKEQFVDMKTIKTNMVDQLKQLKVEDFQCCFNK